MDFRSGKGIAKVEGLEAGRVKSRTAPQSRNIIGTDGVVK